MNANYLHGFAYRWILLILLAIPITFSLPIRAADVPPLTFLQAEPTPLFPRVNPGQPLRQRVFLHLDNPGPPLAIVARITVGDSPAYTEELGDLASGKSVKPVNITDISTPTKLTIELLAKDGNQVLTQQDLTWQPQKKWKLYCVSFSHQDLGYGDYPHRLRTDNRQANFDQALRHCSDTDDWDEDSKYRYVVEGSEALTSYLGGCSEAKAAELGRRIHEGRIELSAMHSVLGAEQISHECLARLFYLTKRHGCDLLGAQSGQTTLLTDTVGPTWPLVTFSAEAGVRYFFHAHNECAWCQELESQPVCYWQGPGDAEQHRLLVRSVAYGRDRICGPVSNDGTYELMKADGSTIESIVSNVIRRYATRDWPYDALLSQDAFDFALATRQAADIAHAWNTEYSHPRLISATLQMFFNDIAGQIDPATIRSYAKDGNNQWADEDPPSAVALALARRTGETLPTAEKYATIASVTTNGGYPWTDIYQGYHSLLRYHEEANGAADWATRGESGAQYYETEQQEYQEMVQDAAVFTHRALDDALGRLVAVITTEADQTLVVFNPLCRARTDIVRVADERLKAGFALLDVATGKKVPCQRMPSGESVFVAGDVPSVGYKVFSIVPEGEGDGQPTKSVENGSQLENRFYRIRFDPTTGAIVSLLDKELNVELVDQSAPHQFNEYLYEHYESPDRKVPARWYRMESAQRSTIAGPVADATVVTGTAGGATRIQQTVILYHDLKRVDFVMTLDKSPSGRTLADYHADSPMGKESVYVALPLSVPDFRIHHELPGAVVEPIRQQFNGTCTAFYAIRHFTDLSNDRFGVTVSPVESSLVEYGWPRSCRVFRSELAEFEKQMDYPANSRLYLFPVNSMFATNIRVDQPGPMTFSWSLRSHQGDWKAGHADQFGWDVHNPLIARVISGKHQGDLPAGSHAFLTLDQPNVVCTAIKPAEFNGAGIILRFIETTGKETTATVSLAMPGQITTANETNLVEDDRPHLLDVSDGKRVTFGIRPFGVTTIRVLYKPSTALPEIRNLKSEPISDREVGVTWEANARDSERISHYRVYRDTKPDFQPGLLNLVQRPAATSCTDRPQLNYGGWIDSRLEPDTLYYYRVAAVDRWNNEGPACAPVRVITLKSSERDSPPLEVEALRAFLVSDLAPYNYINLLWRSNCESDIAKYEVYRDTAAGFLPTEAQRIAVVDVMQRGNGAKRPLREYDHQMYADKDLHPRVTYYYRVCAVDVAGQRGPFSKEAMATTKKE